jgi:hypothetical protein
VAPNVRVFTEEEFKVKAEQNIDMQTLQDLLLKASGKAEIEATSEAIIKAASTLLGSDGATEPAVLGAAMTTLMNAFILAFNAHTHGAPPTTGTPTVPFGLTMGPAEVSTNVKVAT